MKSTKGIKYGSLAPATTQKVRNNFFAYKEYEDYIRNTKERRR